MKVRDAAPQKEFSVHSFNAPLRSFIVQENGEVIISFLGLRCNSPLGFRLMSF